MTKNFKVYFVPLGTIILLITIYQSVYAISLFCSSSSSITNPNIDVLQLPQAYVTYGDDGFIALRFSDVTFKNLTFINPDFVFPLKGEDRLSLNRMDSFSTSNTIFVGNDTFEVRNKVIIMRILMQDKHGNFQNVDLGKPIQLYSKNTDYTDTFTVSKKFQTGDYVLSLSKMINNDLIVTYQTRLSIQ